jgi:hypothetical protein
MGEESEEHSSSVNKKTDESSSNELKVKPDSNEVTIVSLSSSKLMLAIAQKEYEYEVDRKKTFETRAGIFVAFIGVMFTFVSKNIDFAVFTDVPQSRFMLYAVLLGLFYLIPLLLLIFSFYCFTNVIISKTYTRLDMKNFNETRAQLSEDKFAFKIMNYYKEVVKVNTQRNDIKGRYFNYGVTCTGIASGLILILYLISVIL